MERLCRELLDATTCSVLNVNLVVQAMNEDESNRTQ